MKDSQSQKKDQNQAKKQFKKIKKFIRKKPAPEEIKTTPKEPGTPVFKKVYAVLRPAKKPEQKPPGTIPAVKKSEQKPPAAKPDQVNPAPAKSAGGKWNFKKYENDVKLALIPLILACIFIIFHAFNNSLITNIQKNRLTPADSHNTMNPYPFIKNVDIPMITAKAAIITDVDTQVVLYSKNPDLRFSMASTTKIMTALTALDYFKPDSVLTIQTPNVEGSGLGFVPGEKFSFEDLLYAMLLPSANDAAVAIADNYPGGMETFVRDMNEKAADLHLYNTHFSDPTGLDDDGDYTTVVDMAHLASSALKNNYFTTITSTKQKMISTIGNTNQYQLTNLNKLLGTEGVTGIKTGTTTGAGEVLVTSSVENGHEFILVVMNSTDRFEDTKILLDFIKKNVNYITPSLPVYE